MGFIKKLLKFIFYSVLFVSVISVMAYTSKDISINKTSSSTSQTKPSKKYVTSNIEDLEVLDFDLKREDDVLYVIGTVRNNTNRQYSYVQVEINLFDNDNNLVESTLANANNLGPHQNWKFKALVLNNNFKYYKIVKVEGF